MPQATRNLQACQQCRSRKVRCDGARPRCDVCSRRNQSCQWPDELVQGGYKYIFVGDEAAGPAEARDSTLMRNGKRQRQHRRGQEFEDAQIHGRENHDSTTSKAHEPLPLLLSQRLLHIFSQSHQMLELCGCINIDMLKGDLSAEIAADEDAFLLQSIFALSSIYITDTEARSDSRFASAKSLMSYCKSKAQASSRLLSDEPSVTTIQANLVLGLCELLIMATSKAWLHIGLAIRMAQTLRMRREYNRRLVPRQREVRRRTFWACIILDRLVAYCTFRTQTIELPLVELHLPCSEVAFAFGHDSPGPTIHGLGGAFTGTTPESMTLAYFVKTFLLWSPIAQVYVDGGRRVQHSDRRRPAISSLEHEAIMANWLNSLPSEMKWSENNLRAHQSLGQMSHFASMHLLIQHAIFLAHHEHLPHIEEAHVFQAHSSSTDAIVEVSPAGDFDAATISTCLEGANQVVSMLRLIDNTTAGLRHTQLGVCAGIPMVTAASVLLWTHHCSDRTTLSAKPLESEISQAKSDVEYLVSILDAWAKTWGLARAWANCIRLLDEFYQSRYRHGASDGPNLTGDPKYGNAAAGQTKEVESWPASPTPLRDGDGYPDPTMIPKDTYYKVRLITGLVLEQPELCKKFLQASGELPLGTTEDNTDVWEVDLDFSWVNDPDFIMAASTLWPEFSLQPGQ